MSAGDQHVAAHMQLGAARLPLNYYLSPINAYVAASGAEA